MTQALHRGKQLCHVCHLLADLEQSHCRRCQSKLYPRIPQSLSRCWALLIAGALLYIPANLMPIMTVSNFGNTQADTIMSGILVLIELGMAPIALIVFIASIAVPTIKLIGLAYLLLSVQYRWHNSLKQRLMMYRFIEFVGRWSMLDIFVITLLAALVNLGQLAQIGAGHGATAFALVVVLTMFAANLFDPRLLFDALTESDHKHFNHIDQGAHRPL